MSEQGTQEQVQPYSVREQQPRDNVCAVVDMIRQKRKRAAPYAIPAWWHAAAKEAFANSGMGQVEAAAKLSAVAKREQAWTHGTISKFLAGTYVTEELVGAFVAFFDLPLPVYHPATLTEAVALKAAAQRVRETTPATDLPPPVAASNVAAVEPPPRAADVRRDAKLAEADRQLDEISAGRQPNRLRSDDGAKGKPRARAVVPARPATRRS
jgi:hypothetical protein